MNSFCNVYVLTHTIEDGYKLELKSVSILGVYLKQEDGIAALNEEVEYKIEELLSQSSLDEDGDINLSPDCPTFYHVIETDEYGCATIHHKYNLTSAPLNASLDISFCY